MKRVISGQELQEKLEESINLLCNTVKTTLGPKGNNVIIDHSSFTPFITNDGVTIAKNIESEDATVNTILEIAKEASIKTNDVVGDGTTTTLILLQSIFTESLKLIKEGTNPIILKNELNVCLQKIIDSIYDLKITPTKKILNNIAKIAASDKQIGDLVSEVCSQITNKDAINIKEVEEDIIKIDYFRGYTFESLLASNYLLKDKLSLEYKDSLFLIINNMIQDIEDVSDILNEVMHKDKSLVIVANDFDEYFVRNIVSLTMNSNLKCCLLKISEYGMRQRAIQKDLEVITGSKIIENVDNITSDNIGTIKNIVINKDDARLDFKINDRIKNYMSLLKDEATEIYDEFDKEFYNKRLAMFKCGTAQILIGGPTKTETQERRMRLDDAICAYYSSRTGILPGGGITLLKVASNIKEDSEASIIWKKALSKPFEQLMINSGLDLEIIKKKIEETDYSLVYNVSTDQYEDYLHTNVVDSMNGVLNSLINACSIASMLLSTTSLVINEHSNNINKVNEYTEI